MSSHATAAGPAEPARCDECGRLLTEERLARGVFNYSAASDAHVLLARHRAAAHPALTGRP